MCDLISPFLYKCSLQLGINGVMFSKAIQDCLVFSPVAFKVCSTVCLLSAQQEVARGHEPGLFQALRGFAGRVPCEVNIN